MAAGDDYEAMFRAEYPQLVALGVLMSGSVDAGHDLAQETMVRAYDRWDRVGDYENLGGWLRRVLKNLVIDRYRRTKLEAVTLSRLDRREVLEQDPDVAQWSRLVATLPPRQRVVVALFYGDDLSVAEIASVLDMAEGTVKSALFKARQRLSVDLASEVADG